MQTVSEAEGFRYVGAKWQKVGRKDGEYVKTGRGSSDVYWPFTIISWEGRYCGNGGGCLKLRISVEKSEE